MKQWRDFITRLYFVPAVTLLGIVAWYFSAYRGDFVSLWLTPDQQAYRYYEKKAYKKAEVLFEDPAFKAASYYRDHNFSEAARIYKEINSTTGAYNRGNALTMFGEYGEAVAAYRTALGRNPDFREAKENIRVAEKLLKEKGFIDRHTIVKNPNKKEQVALSNKNRSKKKKKNDEKGKKQKIQMPGMALWLDRLSTTPKDFLRQKFAYQYEKEKDDGQ